MMEIENSKRPRDKAQGAFWDYATGKGWRLTKKGFPDYFCWTGEGAFILVEVKNKRGRRLRRHQRMVMKALAKCGVPCYRWDPEDRQFDKLEKLDIPF